MVIIYEHFICYITITTIKINKYPSSISNRFGHSHIVFDNLGTMLKRGQVKNKWRYHVGLNDHSENILRCV